MTHYLRLLPIALLAVACAGTPKTTTTLSHGQPASDAVAPRVASVTLGDGEHVRSSTNKVVVEFTEPMVRSLITVGPYWGNVSCASYDAQEAIVISIDRPDEEYYIADRCIGGTIHSTDYQRFVITLNRDIEQGDTVRVQVSTRSRVEVNRIPMSQPVTSQAGVELAEQYIAEFEVAEPEYASLEPTETHNAPGVTIAI